MSGAGKALLLWTLLILALGAGSFALACLIGNFIRTGRMADELLHLRDGVQGGGGRPEIIEKLRKANLSRAIVKGEALLSTKESLLRKQLHYPVTCCLEFWNDLPGVAWRPFR
jgi:hypothetical protein